jgi:predicted Zn-dependent peptidase
MSIRTSTLGDGLTVVTEDLPHAPSVAVGVWAQVGARDEPDTLAGASHFLEHLLFKGTADRTALEIAEAVDRVGGDMNAFTGREATAFYARVPATELAMAVDLLTDVVVDPAFHDDDVEVERDVILDELAASLDTPDDRIHVALAEAVFPGHPLGREVIGSEDTVSALSRDTIADFHHRYYRAEDLVVVVDGPVDHDDIVERVGTRFPSGRSNGLLERTPPSDEVVPVTVIERPGEQTHVALGWRSLPAGHPERYALAVANQVLGGGLSSRLFQEIREKRGLCYSVWSAPSPASDAGQFTAYAGTAPEQAATVLRLLAGEVDRFVRDGITQEERDIAVGYLTGSLILGLEDTGSRLGRLGGMMSALGRVVPVDEDVEALRAVTVDDVAAVVQRVLGGPRSVAVVGPQDDALDAALAELAHSSGG